MHPVAKRPKLEITPQAAPTPIPSTETCVTTQNLPNTPVRKPSNLSDTSSAAVPQLPSDLGKCIENDVELLKRIGWEAFVKAKRKRGDIGSLDFKHPAKRLLRDYRSKGAPIKLATKGWSKKRLKRALRRGAHKSCMDHLDFLQEEFVSMISKDQWVVLPFELVENLPGLRLSPPGVVPQRDRRPRWICDYSYSDVNEETIKLYADEAMQFGHALDRLLRQILLADPSSGPVKIIKVDISDGFYRLCLSPTDIPKLAVVFPTLPGQQRLVALPLVLPMGWKNSPPIFSTATETIADIANQRLKDPSYKPSAHPLSTLANTIQPSTSPLAEHQYQPNQPSPPTSSQLINSSPPTTPSPTSHHLQVPAARDPCLPSSTLHGYVDVFVDDFLVLAQGDQDHLDQVRSTLMHAVDLVFRPLDGEDSPSRSEPISVKKLMKGDCTWDTCKVVLGWLIDTVAQTIQLPIHRVQRLAEILASIPKSQKRIGIKKWHKILGELRSMSLALPGSRNLFSQMQLALQQRFGARIALKKGVHQSLQDFKYLLDDIASRPTRIAELVPLKTSVVGHHDAAKGGAGGVWFPSETIHRRDNNNHHPLVWRFEWPKSVQDRLVTDSNPNGDITNSDLELAGGLLHLQALAQSCDIRERTVLSKTDKNLATLYWQRKGSATTDSCPAHLLRLFGLHQRYHRYVPRHDYLSGPSNPLADASSRLFSLDDTNFLKKINSLYSQPQPFRLLHLEPSVTSCVISALLRKQSSPVSLLVEPSPPKPLGSVGSDSALAWPSTPFSKPARVKYQSYRSLRNVFGQEQLLPKDVPSSLDRLRITYGTLAKRSLEWGPTTPA